MKLPRVWKTAAVVVTAVLLAGVGAYVLIVRSQPTTLGLAANRTSTPAPIGSPDDPLAQACREPAIPTASEQAGLSGLWVVQPGSVAGYRAHEKFAELPSPHVAVARSDRVSGWLLAADQDGVRSIVTACVAVDLSRLVSVDELPGFNTSDRDGTARDMLNVRTHPYAIFQPYPARITADITGGKPVHLRLEGVLEVNGVRRSAAFELDVRLTSGQAAVAGSTIVDVDAYGVRVPQEAGRFVAVDPRITLEISLILLRP